MVKKYIATILIAILMIASAYVIYNQYYASPSSSSSSPSSKSPSNDAQSSSTGDASTDSSSTHKSSASSSSESSNSTGVTVIDGAGYYVALDASPKRVLVMDAGLAEILYILGAQDLVVGRTSDVVFPTQFQNLPSVGQFAYYASLEAILDLQPDLVISSSQFGYSPVCQQLRDLDIAVYLDSSDNPPAIDTSKMTPAELYNCITRVDVVCDALKGVSELVGRKGQMDAYITWAQSYNKLVKDRLTALTSEQRETVFYEWHAYPYRTYVDISIYQGGGINIAEGHYGDYSSTLSPEFVVEQNPSAIIALISSVNHDVNDFIAAKNEILNRPALKDVDAVNNERVYICDFAARNGLRSVIGYLYYAQCLQPALFSDIDLTTVSQQLYQQFGIPMSGTYCR